MEISRREISDMIPLVWRKVSIPAGLGSIMETITREVIREQPKDLNMFIAQLLEAEAEKEWPSEKEPQVTKDGVKRESVTEATQLLSTDQSRNKSQDASVALDMDQSASTTMTLSEEKRDNVSLEPERVVESSPVAESKAFGETKTEQAICSQASDDNEVMKKGEDFLDTTEIEKIRRGGDFEAISKTITTDESLDIEDGELENDDGEDEEEDEDEEQDAGISEGELEKGNDNYDDEEDEEEEEDSEYGNEDEHVAEILSKHLQDSKSDNELNEAATKIQAGFRGYKARKTLRERKATSSPGSSRTGTDDEHGQHEAQMVSPLRTETLDVPRRKGTRNARQNAKYRSGMVFDGDDDTSDYDNPSSEEILGLGDEYMNKAATRIQANVRGWMTRKHVEKEKYAANNKKVAATKIQATVRGFLTRRRLAKARAGRRRSSHGATLVSSKRRSSLGLKQEAAATKIQAAFRGYNVRKTKPKKKPTSSGPVAINESDDDDDSREILNIQTPLESTTEE